MSVHAGRRARIRLLAAVAAGLAAGAVVAADDHSRPAYPPKAIRLVVPFPAGGQGDIVGRLLAEQLSQRLSQQVYVDNRSHAGGNIGSHFAATSEPDGSTLLLVPDSNVSISPLIHDTLPYNPITDLAPVAKVADTGLVLVSSPAGRIRTLADVISEARALGGGLSYGTAGVGTNAHVFAELFKQQTGINLVHVPYKGGAPAITDVMGNQIPLVVTAVASAIPHIRSEKLVGIAVSTQVRSKSLPDVPTSAESGLPDLFYNSWLGVFAPAKTPRRIIARLKMR